MKTSLTGIKPTATPHLGNYLGAIRPALKLDQDFKTFYFIADYHALTTVRDPKAMKTFVYDVAAVWLAAGLDPEHTVFFKQSSVPEVFELSWVLSCLVATGQLERGHAYKDAADKGENPNAGIFYYPILMAADILLYDTHVVPIGKDQKQHLELARDVAVRINHVFGDNTVVVPAPLITEAPLVPGTDGQKMSKSKGNTIPLFDTSKRLKKSVMSIVTGSETLEEPKVAEGSVVFELYKYMASAEEADKMAQQLKAGGYGWGHAKMELFEKIDHELTPMRDKFTSLRADEKKLDAILDAGAQKAKKVASETLRRVRTATGI